MYFIIITAVMSNPKELSILSNWLEERLKEYFVRKAQLQSSSWGTIFSGHEPDFSSFFAFNHGNRAVSIQAVVSDFRILEFKMEKCKSKRKKKHVNGNFPNNHDHQDNVPDETFQSSAASPSTSYKKAQVVDELESYQQQNSHVYLVYQETSQSIGKELWLHLQAYQVVDVKAMEDIIPKYELSLDEHQIDMYTRVFPFLRYWSAYKKVPLSLPVQECYYGSYETEEHERNSGVQTENDDAGSNNNINDYMFEDDIMSKVAAGLEFYERDRRRREEGKSGKQSSYRLLILEDVSKLGFELKNVGCSSTFLSLLNVEEALKSLAEIHSVSWAYSQVSGKSLLKTWPFLNNPLYLPYIKERVESGFLTMERLVQAYLIESGKETGEEAERILKSLMKLSAHLKEILERVRHPKTVKCLIHQSTSFSSFLFRYSMLTTDKRNETWKKGKVKSVDNQSNMRDHGRDCDKNRNDDEKVKSLLSSPLNSRDNNNDDEAIPKAGREGLKKALSREVMIINWRTASIGSPMIDVAFLLLTALSPKIRRVETASLLNIYWNSFKTHAKKFGQSLRWSDKELYEDYLGALLYTCVLITGNITASQCELDDEGMDVFIEAVKDLIRENVI